jgi:sterol desaturase/sphingolipid hydroxylase (fatty acid hydroxylase superfamily)
MARATVSEYLEMRQQLDAIWIIPAVGAILMVGEWLYVRFVERAEQRFDGKETASSLGIAALDYGMRPLVAGLMAAPLYWVHQHRLFDIPATSVLALLALVVVADLMDYWFHRTSHHLRALWAIHIVHHTPTRINLFSGVRLSFLAPVVSSAYWFTPLIFVGFHPIAVVLVINAILLYHFLLHSAYTPSFGRLEWLLNTPTHHRVHHAVNPTCINKNFSTVFILWDRMFGTFATAPKDEPLRYGLTRPIGSHNPFVINLHELGRMAGDFVAARGLRARLRTLVKEPS